MKGFKPNCNEKKIECILRNYSTVSGCGPTGNPTGCIPSCDDAVAEMVGRQFHDLDLVVMDVCDYRK